MTHDFKALHEELTRLDSEAAKGPWEVEDHGTRTLEESGSAILDADGLVLCDTLNASKTETIQDCDEGGGRWFEIGRRPSLDLIVFLRNNLPTILAALELAEMLQQALPCEALGCGHYIVDKESRAALSQKEKP